ncbi:hypothetical protein DXG01_010964 [Tephrocybe rancida]|nr:hypothetical protein DXG01_010964 [Tephrocybe rancida]
MPFADCIQDNLKICDGGTEIMYRDPRRRFIFSFTVQPARGAAPPYSSATTEQLGYHPTIRRHLVYLLEGNFQFIPYEHIVEETSYRPRETQFLNSLRTTSFHERLWQARELVSEMGEEPLQLSEKCYILKDAWQYSDARLENRIQQDIFGCLADIDGKEDTKHATDAKPIS